MAKNNSWNGGLPVNADKGGTGVGTLAANGVLLGNGTGAVTATAAGTNTQVLTALTGGVPTFQTPTVGATTQVQVTLTSAEVKALHATPIQIVAAPGAGKFIAFTSSVAKLHYGGSNVFVTGGQPIVLAWGNPVQQYCANNNTYFSANIGASVDTIVWQNQTNSNEYTATKADNQPLTVSQSSVTEITGNAANDNTITISVNYIVLTL